MILIESVKYREVPGNYAEVRDHIERQMFEPGSSLAAHNDTFSYEICEGRRFVRPSDGLDVVIASTADVQGITMITLSGGSLNGVIALATAQGYTSIGWAHRHDGVWTIGGLK